MQGTFKARMEAKSLVVVFTMKSYLCVLVHLVFCLVVYLYFICVLRMKMLAIYLSSSLCCRHVHVLCLLFTDKYE